MTRALGVCPRGTIAVPVHDRVEPLSLRAFIEIPGVLELIPVPGDASPVSGGSLR